MSNKNSLEFLALVGELEPIEFIGLSKILGVSFIDEKKPRDFYLILSDCLKKFETLSRKKRKEVLKILSAAKKEKQTLLKNEEKMKDDG